eukprot:NODE_9880_length_458_cov_4.660147_g8781_i0.p4 GENE.NODE_9880_length_458_cov_4.660147_g8781_i0~~NODE_9880_length_458_cov_4.660147_g8781_i0.p4  ORF type:complete len:70 (-),score=0.76 NODE_9880_length_458_cov_4.660147_g8781_i0:80-289(-)
MSSRRPPRDTPRARAVNLRQSAVQQVCWRALRCALSGQRSNDPCPDRALQHRTGSALSGQGKIRPDGLI